MIKYVFFDLDHTLIDTKTAEDFAANNLYNIYGFNKIASFQDFLKKWNELTKNYYKLYTTKQISHEEQRIKRIEGLFAAFNQPLVELPLHVYDKYLKFCEDAWKAFPDANSTLKSLKKLGYKIGLISNGDFQKQVSKLKKIKILKYFDYVNTSSECDYSKPDVRLFKSVFYSNDIPVNEVCYVGDSYEKDYIPSVEAGCSAVLVNRKNLIFNKKVVQITDLNELIAILNNKSGLTSKFD